MGFRRTAFFALMFVLMIFVGCGEEKVPVPQAEISEPEKTAVQFRPEDNMTLDDKLWQLFFVTPEAVSGEGAMTSVTDNFAEVTKIKKVGGIILFADNIANAEQVTKFNSDISACFETPVFIGVDEEGGTVSRLGRKGIITDNGKMNKVGASGDISAAEAVGESLGSELSALGFSVDFAPVADVLINPKNTEIGSRSFGSEPDLVGSMVSAETKAMQRHNVSAVLKHFPGHGSTTANSHNGASVSMRTLEQLREEELVPFRAGIEAGADFVMISHISLPQVVGADIPCSLSPYIITELLRNELGFDGIIITDALNMGAVSGRYSSGDAAVMSIEAGADMLLMPENLDEAHDAIAQAVESGRISEKRINESVRRILTVKQRRGLIEE